MRLSLFSAPLKIAAPLNSKEKPPGYHVALAAVVVVASREARATPLEKTTGCLAQHVQQLPRPIPPAALAGSNVFALAKRRRNGGRGRRPLAALLNAAADLVGRHGFNAGHKSMWPPATTASATPSRGDHGLVTVAVGNGTRQGKQTSSLCRESDVVLSWLRQLAPR